MTKKVDMIVDLQYGSTGKGLIAGYLAEKIRYDVVVNANMPNAGHTFIDAKGQKMIHKVLPNGIVSPRCRFALIGPGSVFSIDQLILEVEQAKKFGYMKGVQVIVHQSAVPLMPHHAYREEQLDAIGSTKQGSMAAMIDKMERDTSINVITRDLWNNFPQHLSDVILWADNHEYNAIINEAHSVLAEGAQGFSLGINEQFYPYCTSRDCSPARFMSDMAIPLPFLRTVIGTARTYPIRVGGTSGGHYDDQKETSWKELGLEKEFTTVTGRERRVFTFSRQQIKDAMYMFAPDEVFLNFCNYIDKTNWNFAPPNREITATAIMQTKELRYITNSFNKKIKYMGYGPTIGDVHEI